MRLLLYSFSLWTTLAFGQGYNYANLPFLGAGINFNSCSNHLPPNAYSGLVLWTDIYLGVTNNANVQAGNSDAVKSWRDASGNNFHLLNLGAAQQPTYFITGGPTNGPYIQGSFFNGSLYPITYLTNWCGGTINSQPNTYFFILRDNGNASYSPVYFSSMDGTNQNRMYGFNGGGAPVNAIGAPGAGASLWGITGGDDAAAFGYAYTTWEIVCVQFNGTNSVAWINGVGPRKTSSHGPLYNPGVAGQKGFTLANDWNQASGGAAMDYTSVIWFTGSSMLNTNNIVEVFRYLGCRYGINVP